MVRPLISDDAKLRYAALVKKHFGFLEMIHGMRFGGVRRTGRDDPRDSALVVRYARVDLRADIGWNESEMSLAVLVRFERDDLSRLDRYVYLEPFIEFLTGWQRKALVPYVKQGMSITQIEGIMSKRAQAFKNGLDSVIPALASKMEAFFSQIEAASSDTIRHYHTWMRS